MNIKRGVAATLIAGAVGLSGFALASGVAGAATPQPTWSASQAVDGPTVQTVGWHGGGWGHHGHGFRGHGPGYFPGWHPRGFPHWGWRHW